MDGKVRKGLTPEEIIKIKLDIDKIREVKECAIMFVDLVDSTAFKEQHPDELEWLPRLTCFLKSISDIVIEKGRVIKYIGDEVMAVFESNNCLIDAEQCAIQIIQFCNNFKEYEFNVKIAIDFGKVSFVDFIGSSTPHLHCSGDPQGTVVDKCARIASKCKSGSILCSEDFFSESIYPKMWQKCGVFTGKGIKNSIKVYEMVYEGMQTVGKIEDPEMDLEECIKNVKDLKQKLDELIELKNR